MFLREFSADSHQLGEVDARVRRQQPMPLPGIEPTKPRVGEGGATSAILHFARKQFWNFCGVFLKQFNLRLGFEKPLGFEIRDVHIDQNRELSSSPCIGGTRILVSSQS